MAAGFLFLSLTQNNYFWIGSLLSTIGLLYAAYESVRFYRALPPAQVSLHSLSDRQRTYPNGAVKPCNPR